MARLTNSVEAELDAIYLAKAQTITSLRIKALPTGKYMVQAKAPGEPVRFVPIDTFAQVQAWLLQHLKDVG